MNSLQPLETKTNLFVTLNPLHPIDERRCLYETHYRHPIFNAAAMRAQEKLWSLQGTGGVWYAGAHFGYGFHEDGLQSGLKAAEDMGGLRRPWTAPDMNGRILSLADAA